MILAEREEYYTSHLHPEVTTFIFNSASFLAQKNASKKSSLSSIIMM